ncbi:MAG TPA: HAMP domain-containing sensor histidine kinase [Angustibacter sp.]|nr:HAMP domain-containing sensor histidine kinase [Angustibacter sp.]
MSAHPARARWRRHAPTLGVRGRSVLASVVVVTVALTIGALVFVTQLQRALLSGVEQDATAQALQVAELVHRDGARGLDEDVAASVRGGQLVQVLDDSGGVTAASSSRARSRPLSSARPAIGQVIVRSPSRQPLVDDDSDYLLAVTATTWSGQQYRVVVAAPIGAQQESVRTALSLLLVGLPALVVLVGVATWLLVGRALSPVERMRARVAAIGGSRVRQRLEVPSTGDEIARLATTLNDMLDRLEHAGQVQRQFVADAGHELRSPLSTLTAAVEVARRESDAGAWAELSDVMQAELDRLTQLVENLLLLSKVDELGLEIATQDVDLDDLVDEQRRRLLAHPGLQLQVTTQPTRVRGDRSRLAQVLANLVDNAVRHTRSLVRISVRTDGDHAIVIVEDDGPGVPAAQRRRVFERFVRLDDSRGRRSGGSGLGLAIVAEIVQAHGGTVSIGDRPGGGCRVEVRLPVPVPGDAPAAEGGQPPFSASR